MKRFIVLALFLSVLVYPLNILAERGNSGFELGIYNREVDFNKAKKYKELILITGEPIIVEGTIEPKVSNNKKTYKYKLENKDKGIELTRSLDFLRDIEESASKKQVVEVNGLTKFSETIKTNKGEYVLEDYQFHNSSLDDGQAIVDFFQGNWEGVKTYSIDKDKGKVTVNMSGETFGYKHYWGHTETQRIHQDISYMEYDGDSTKMWNGVGDVDIVFNRTKDMTYFQNQSQQSSFDGGYTLTEKSETVMKYQYDLPYEGSQTIRNISQGVERYDSVPTQKRLFVPKYKDIKGHWAEANIKKMSGLQVVEEKNYFGPDLNAKRAEFAKWIVKAMDLTGEETKKSKKKKEPDLYEDISAEVPEYNYIKIITEKEIMTGVGHNRFSPDEGLTRAEAISVVIRALGLERLAPAGSYKTKFIDDGQIPAWAKKNIYVANEIGIANGNNGYIYPNDTMTKAEAITFIMNVIEYLQDDLKLHYREYMIN